MGNIKDYYTDQFSEEGRLAENLLSLEWIRTIDILERYLPKKRSVIYDIGGGTGKYSEWLLKKGHEVHLVDIVPKHVELAKKRMKCYVGSKHSAVTGDARKTSFADSSADAVLLLGPLYHFQGKKDRLQVLGETKRILKPGGIMICAIISRFASFIDGLDRGFIHDPAFRKIIAGDLKNSRHKNPTSNPEYFTESYFQHPFELEEEIRISGFRKIRLISVEGIMWIPGDLDALANDLEAWEAVLGFLREIEEDRSIIGVSPHIIGIGEK